MGGTPRETREDLWRTLVKSCECTIEIAELEFVIEKSRKREIDSVYNFISQAAVKLSDHLQGAHGTNLDIEKCICSLRKLLDGEKFTLICKDESGKSGFKPSEGVVFEEL